MSNPVPRSIQEYLDQLRAELAGADPALIQDALYDAEEYIRAEMDANRGKTEEQVLASIATSYGAPEEVAEAYRNTEVKVQKALRTPRPKQRSSSLGRFFSVFTDPYAYTAYLYMLLSLPIGIFCFTWTVAGLGMSAGFMVLIIGVPFFLLFLGSMRLFSLVEGRIVEVLLGVRMPRRPVHPGGVDRRPIMERIKEVLGDPRTWGTIIYMLIRMPLGVIYFTLATVLGSVALSLLFAPIETLFTSGIWLSFGDLEVISVPWIFTPFFSVLGLLLLTGLMYLSKGVGWFHGHLAKNLLVKAG